MDYSAVLM